MRDELSALQQTALEHARTSEAVMSPFAVLSGVAVSRHQENESTASPASSDATESGTETVLEALRAIREDATTDSSTESSGGAVPGTTKVERRGPAHAHARNLVSKANARNFPKSHHAQSPNNSVFWVDWNDFDCFNHEDFLAIVRVAKARSCNPMLCIEIDTPTAYTRIDLALSIVPGPQATSRVELAVRGGEGFYFCLLEGWRLFRDEVFIDEVDANGQRELAPNLPPGNRRVRANVGFQSLVLLKRSLI